MTSIKKDYEYIPPEAMNLNDTFKEFVTNYDDIDADVKSKVLDIYAQTYNPACGYFAHCYS